MHASGVKFFVGFWLIFATAAAAEPLDGFLKKGDVANIQWLQPQPDAAAAIAIGDVATYLALRKMEGTDRWKEAAADDVYKPDEVAPRFSDALGVQLTPENAIIILDLVGRAQTDLEALTHPAKPLVVNGGRPRPYVRYPELPACDDKTVGTSYEMKPTGSYPSTHAALGLLWAQLLAQIAPDRAELVFAKGYQFGESRLVCGFHYPSDLSQGRLAATVLFSKLLQSGKFAHQLELAKLEMKKIRGTATRSELKTVTRAETEIRASEN